MNVRLKYLLFSLVLSVTSSFAQRVVTVEGSSLYVAPETMSLKEAKEKALHSAKVEAMAKEFGTLISQRSLSLMDESQENFYLEGEGAVKGEWIETIGTPLFECSLIDDEIFVKCTVKGKARELKDAKVELDVAVMCNDIKGGTGCMEFKSGDKIYLKFKSPINGYLAVFLHDTANDEVMALLPYKRDRVSAMRVESDKEYILFSKKHNDYGLNVQEYIMGCESKRDVNTLYVVFSKAEFSKPSLSIEDGKTVLKHLDFEKFNSWIVKSQTYDSCMQVEKFVISISK